MKFMDPRIDFAFKKIFGSENAKDILISFLESLLQLEGERRIAEVTILDPFLLPKTRQMKYSILDVKCQDQRGITYIVEMQIQKVAAFLKRIQYNSSKTYVSQIEHGEEYPKLNQVIAITITDFVLFGGFEHCVSRHESRESVTGHSYLQEILHFFVELPKFKKSLESLENNRDKWIYFIKHADSLREIPAKLSDAPFRHAFEMAMVANMTNDELELYEKAGMAITDARGAIQLAREEGEQKGLQEGRQEGATRILTSLLQRRFGTIPDWVTEKITKAESPSLEEWSLRVLEATSLDSVFADQERHYT
ncbi:MAG: Rpn family recombination-promoting nuclease/putative transposase [Magnetococcus sp. YQC-5]